MHKLLCALFIVCSVNLFAQPVNLVPDSSFEFYNGCPKEFSNFHLSKYWYSPTNGTPDLFSTCNVMVAPVEVDKKKSKKKTGYEMPIKKSEVPVNDIGFQHPHSGNSYAGFAAYASINKEYSEYITVKLTKPLQKGVKYRLRFYISLADKSFYWGTKIGIVFPSNHVAESDANPIKDRIVGKPKMYYAENTESIDTRPDIEFDLSGFNDTTEWKMLEAYYTPAAAYDYIVIGSFGKPASTGRFAAKDKTTGELTDRKPYTYYYIDDVSVTEMKPVVPPGGVTLDGIATLPVADKPFVIPNLYFDTDKWDILPKSYKSLDSVAVYLKTLVGLTIEVNGHTDEVGTDEHNLSLSENRAKSVTDYLISKGVKRNVISYKGYGETLPISKTNKDINRRVEIKLVKIDDK